MRLFLVLIGDVARVEECGDLSGLLAFGHLDEKSTDGCMADWMCRVRNGWCGLRDLESATHATRDLEEI